MGKLDPVGEGKENSGSVIGGWGGPLLWEACVPGFVYEANVEYDPAKIQNSWVDNKEEILIYVCKK